MEEPKNPTEHQIQNAGPLLICGRCAKVWRDRAAIDAEQCQPIDNPLELATRVALNAGQALATMTDDEAEAAHAQHIYNKITSPAATHRIDQLLMTMHTAIAEKGAVEALHEAYHSARQLGDELGDESTATSLVAWAYACYQSRYQALAPEPQQ